MSKENLEQFMEQVAGSEELQAKIGEEIDAEALIALGAECGCEFTAEELQDSAELSAEELDGVAGGASGTEFAISEAAVRSFTGKILAGTQGLAGFKISFVHTTSAPTTFADDQANNTSS